MSRLPTVLLSALLCAGAAQAATVGYAFQFGQETTDIDQTGELTLFDSTLGTLTDVSLTLSGTYTTQLSLTNTGRTALNATASSLLELYFRSSLPGLDALFAPDPEAGGDPLLQFSVSTKFSNLAAGRTQSSGLVQRSATRLVDVGALLDSFSASGGGSFSLHCSSMAGLMLSARGGNLSFSQSSTAGCGASILYTYEAATLYAGLPTQGTQGTAGTVAVPAPPSLALAGLGLAGLALSRRVRRGHAARA